MIVLGIVLGLLLSSLFSASETAYITTPTSAFPRLLPRGMGRWFVDHPDRVFAAILLGNNLANAAVAILLALWLYRLHPSSGTWILSGAGATVLLIIFGEILPKTLARRMGEHLVRLIFPFLYFFAQVTTPLLGLYLMLWRRVFSLNRQHMLIQEISWVLLSLRQHRRKPPVGPWALQLALEFLQKPVSSVMIPAHRLQKVPISARYDEVLARMCRVPWNRLFVYDEEPFQIVGILHVQDLLRARHHPETWARKVRPPVRVLEEWPLHRVLNVLRESRIPIAIVVDEFGNLRGMVSDEILFETMVSFFWPQGRWKPGVEVSTFLPLRTLKLHGVPIEGPDEESLSAWILRNIKTLPGSRLRRIRVQNLTLEITERTPSRIEKVRIWWEEPASSPSSGTASSPAHARRPSS